MPIIDETKLSKGKFKKTQVRSWDNDLLSALLIKDDKPEKEAVTDKNNTTINYPKNKTIKASKLVKVEDIEKPPKLKSSNNLKVENNKVKIDKNKLDFLSEDFKFNKLMKRLSGNEKVVLLAIVNICNQKGSNKTGLISGDDLDEYLGLKRNSRETALKRLCKKEILKRYSGKRGVGGFLNLGMTDKVLEIANNFNWD